MQATRSSPTYNPITPRPRRIRWVRLLVILLMAAKVTSVGAGEEKLDKSTVRSGRAIADRWELIEVSGAMAGYGRVREHSLERGGKKLRQIESVMRMRMQNQSGIGRR